MCEGVVTVNRIFNQDGNNRRRLLVQVRVSPDGRHLSPLPLVGVLESQFINGDIYAEPAIMFTFTLVQ